MMISIGLIYNNLDNVKTLVMNNGKTEYFSFQRIKTRTYKLYLFILLMQPLWIYAICENS